MSYNKSKFFKRLEKLAELEKRIAGTIEQARDNEGDVDISSLVNEGKSGLSSIRKTTVSIPKLIASALMQKRRGVNTSELNSCIDDGIDATSGHFAKHKISVSPEEAAYIAIGKKDDGIRSALSGLKISDILSMIGNKAAVSEYSPEKSMNIEDYDQPKHIRIMIVAKGMSPGELGKAASTKNPIGQSTIFEAVELELSTGQKVRKNKEQAVHDKTKIQEMVDDGTIIKIIKILSSGQNKVVYNKFAAEASVDDILYLMTYAG